MALDVPGPISASGKIKVGDTIEFVEKFNSFYSEIIRYGGELNNLAVQLNSFIPEFESAATDANNKVLESSDQAVDKIDRKFIKLNTDIDAAKSSMEQIGSGYETLLSTIVQNHNSDFSENIDQYDTKVQGLFSQMVNAITTTEENQKNVESLLLQAKSVSDNIDAMLQQVILAQQQALILAEEQLPENTIARFEKELRKIKFNRIVN